MRNTSIILHENFLHADYLVSSSVSSELASLPATNLYNFARRSKVWRSAGYWEITASNNTIVFRESVGVDLTATIAVANYTTSSAFFTAIKTALDAAGDSTYTVVADTDTKKVKITSNGGGGGGIFQIMWTTSDDIADTLGFDDSTNDTGALTYTADELRIHTSEWVKWDLGITSNPQAFCLIAERNLPLQISNTATLTLQGNNTDVWTAPAYSASLATDDRVIYKVKDSDDDGLHTEGLRYWRLVIVDVDNPNGYIEFGVAFLGEFFQPTRGAIQFPFSSDMIDMSETSFSEGGQSFTDEKEKSESFNVEWNGLTVSEKEIIDEIWDEYGLSVPFFVSIDPNAAMSSAANYYIRYVKFASEPSITLVSPGVFSCNMRLREEL